MRLEKAGFGLIRGDRGYPVQLLFNDDHPVPFSEVAEHLVFFGVDTETDVQDTVGYNDIVNLFFFRELPLEAMSYIRRYLIRRV